MAGIHFSFSNTLTFPYPPLHGNQKQSKPEAELPDRMMPLDSHYLDWLLSEEGGAVWSRTEKEEVGVHGPVGISLLLRAGCRMGRWLLLHLIKVKGTPRTPSYLQLFLWWGEYICLIPSSKNKLLEPMSHGHMVFNPSGEWQLVSHLSLHPPFQLVLNGSKEGGAVYQSPSNLHGVREGSTCKISFLISFLLFSPVQSLCHVQLLWPHEIQSARLPCPSPAPRACSNWCPLSQWCHPTISSPVVPFSHPSIFPSIGVFSNETTISHKKWVSTAFQVLLVIFMILFKPLHFKFLFTKYTQNPLYSVSFVLHETSSPIRNRTYAKFTNRNLYKANKNNEMALMLM